MNTTLLLSALQRFCLRFLCAGNAPGMLILSLTACSAVAAAEIPPSEGQAPAAPGEITVTDISANGARISWVAAKDPDGVSLSYNLQIRKRIEGVAQAWQAAGETVATTKAVSGLAAGTVYDVRVRAWAKTVSGPWATKENAFRTLPVVENHAPSIPGAISVTEVTARRARISWGASADADGDGVAYYLVSLRKHIAGVLPEWVLAGDSSSTSIVVDGLAPETTYDVRVRASDGKLFSDWRAQESVFKTLTEASLAPTAPGEITITDITAGSARIAWVAAKGPDGASLGYEVQIRKHIEGVAQDWIGAGETVELTKGVDGLSAGTFYDVRVRAWARAVSGPWAVKENAFMTLAAVAENHPPGLPGLITVTDVTARSARISWGISRDTDGDRVAYLISLRKRVEGVALEWMTAKDTSATSIVWEQLSPATLYEVRVRASDGKLASDWVTKEHGFRTLAGEDAPVTGEKTEVQFERGFSNSELVLAWPSGAAQEFVLEETDDPAGTNWTKVEVPIQTVNGVNKVSLPLGGTARFFRLRK